MILCKIKEHREDLVVRWLFWCPVGALLEPYWGTLGALSVPTCLTSQKKQNVNGTLKIGVPAAGCQALGETLSKQVYLGRV